MIQVGELSVTGEYGHEVLVNRLGLGLPRNSVVMLSDRPDRTIFVYRGREEKQQYINTQIN